MCRPINFNKFILQKKWIKIENITVTVKKKIIKKTRIFFTGIVFLPINYNTIIREKIQKKKHGYREKKNNYEKNSLIFLKIH